MAPPLTTFLLLAFFFLFQLFSSATAAGSPGDDGFNFGPEKRTHLHFFFHDVVSGPNPTAIRVAAAPTTNRSATGFGAVVIIDDPLTEEKDLSSKLIGRAQGIYALASQEESGLLMTVNYSFLEGEYNGSSLAILGRNAVKDDAREMPVVGGSGHFRMARGYAIAHTVFYDNSTGDTTVEYNVYVVHH